MGTVPFAQVVLDPTDGPELTNIILNPAFEFDTVGSAPALWSNFVGSPTTRQVQLGPTGAKEYRIVTATLASGAQGETGPIGPFRIFPGAFAITAGQQLAIAVDVLVNSIVGTMTLFVSVQWNNGATFISDLLSPSVGGTGQATLSNVWTAPATTTNVLINIGYLSHAAGSQMDFWIQDMLAVINPVGGVVPAFFDGNTLGESPASNYQWTGNPGGSASRRVNSREPLPLLDGIDIDQGGIDWGDAAITAYMADQDVGSSPVDYRLPNRIVNIPLGVGMTPSNTFDAASAALRSKVARMQMEGGWLQRQPGFYAEVVNATLTFPDDWQESAGLEPNVKLQLECLPDFFGDEIVLDTLSATGIMNAVLLEGGAPAIIEGDLPGRVDIRFQDTSGNTQNALLWAFRSKHYDSATTAADSYEAEALTPVGGATITGLTGASGGGSTLAENLVPVGSWTTLVSTNLLSGAQMTHSGSYRVWARVSSTVVGTAVRLLWGVGSLSVPIVNNMDYIPSASGLYMLDLGEIRIDPNPVGPPSWYGAIQVYATNLGEIFIDKLYYQPLDDGAGSLKHSAVLSPSMTVSTAYATTVYTNHTGTQQTWQDPSSSLAADGNPAYVYMGSGTGTGGSDSDLINTVGYGFAIPSSVTILGIEVDIAMYDTDYPAFQPGLDSVVNLIKAGTPVGTNKATFTDVPGSPEVRTYGGPSDLWGTTWSPFFVNDPYFGVQFQASDNGSIISVLGIDYMRITVYYAYAGFVVPADAVIYANQMARLTTSGMYRSDPTGAVYGAVSSVLGSMPRIPPSGLEARPCELFLKPSRGDLDTTPDSGLDSFTAQVRYRPSYLFRI